MVVISGKFVGRTADYSAVTVAESLLSRSRLDNSPKVPVRGWGCHGAFEKSFIEFVVVVQSLSRVQVFVTPCTAACQASLSFSISQILLKPMSIELVMLSNNFILCCPLLLLSIIPNTEVFSSESALPIRWPVYWSFSFSSSPSNEYSGLISNRIDCFDLLAVQGTLKSLAYHHNSKGTILQHSAFFMVQLSHLY